MIKHIFLSVVLFFSFSCAQTKSPVISVSELSYDFGDINQNEIVAHEYVIKNTGTSELIIDRVNSSCGCTVAQPENNSLQPGESTKLKAEFNTTGRSGPQVKQIFVFSNDPNNQMLILEFKANIVVKPKENDETPKIKFDKNQYNFGSIEEGKLYPYTFTFQNIGKGVLKINDVRTSCGCTAALVEGHELKSGESGKIKIEFDTKGRSGRQSKTIVVLTNDPANPVSTLTIYADIKPKN